MSRGGGRWGGGSKGKRQIDYMRNNLSAVGDKVGKSVVDIHLDDGDSQEDGGQQCMAIVRSGLASD